jgi:hypothetical protein
LRWTRSARGEGFLDDRGPGQLLLGHPASERREDLIEGLTVAGAGLELRPARLEGVADAVAGRLDLGRGLVVLGRRGGVLVAACLLAGGGLFERCESRVDRLGNGFNHCALALPCISER